jgi:hypothetical protein
MLTFDDTVWTTIALTPEQVPEEIRNAYDADLNIRCRAAMLVGVDKIELHFGKDPEGGCNRIDTWDRVEGRWQYAS